MSLGDLGDLDDLGDLGDLGDLDDRWPRLMVLTDRSQLALGRGLVRTIAECVSVGLTHVVVRELDEPETARASLVEALVGVGATVISARTPLPGGTAVHLPACMPARSDRDDLACMHARNHRDDLACMQARSHHDDLACMQARSPHPWGRSCHSVDQLRAAAGEGAAYAFLSPYADGGSKPGRTPLPAAAFAGHAIPVYALGGITPANARAAREAGAHGVAVMGAVMAAGDPARVVEQLLEATA
ncbi:thiamine phosphate synthase [Nocardioides montaniterrae]